MSDADKQKEVEEGDVVRLKSGGPLMTVELIYDFDERVAGSSEVRRVKCAKVYWYDDGTLQESKIRPQSLRVANGETVEARLQKFRERLCQTWQYTSAHPAAKETAGELLSVFDEIFGEVLK